MSPKVRRAARSKVAFFFILIALGVPGCATDAAPGAASTEAPQALSSATASTTPTATGSAATSPDPADAAVPASEPSFIIISGNGFDVVYKDGSESGNIPFESDSAAAIALLSTVTGAEPVEEVITGDGVCNPTYQTNKWDGMTVHNGEQGWWRPEAARFDILVTASHVGGVRIVTPDGHSVGDSIDAFAQGLPTSSVIDWGDATKGGTTVRYDVVDPQAVRTWGASASAGTLRGPISELRASVWFDAEC